MGFSALFIRRPVATILLSLGILLAGAVAYFFLPVAPLPSVDIPTIVVFAAQPGADARTMANSIAAPLERRLGEIAGVTEITSLNSIGSTSIIIQFDISRNIDGAAHDVQAALNAAATDLPANLPTPPYYREFNPAESPILTLALTSDTLSGAEVYDAADTILGQRLSQVEGVSQVQLNGAETPAVRIQLDPVALAATGLAAQDVFNAIRAANVNEPTGSLSGNRRAESLGVNGQMSQARQYRSVILKTNGNATLRVSDVARVVNGVTNSRLAAWDGEQAAILLQITKSAGANVIDTTDRVLAALPQLISWLPHGVHLSVISDRTGTIRASIAEIQYTLLLTVVLVLLVVLIFLRRLMPMLAAAVTVPLSIAGTLAAMWFLNYSLDNFSLLALTISVGFVVDDAIVMIENIYRHMELGETPLQAALLGARQIGFTVMSISLSLVAVFIPIIFMGGILGRLFHEFAMTLSLAIAVSAAVSLTLTPMICGRLVRQAPKPPRAWLARIDRVVERAVDFCLRFYVRTLDWALRQRLLMLALTFGAMALTIWLYVVVPKGLLPIEDTGLLLGTTLASPDVSFKAMSDLQRSVVRVLLADPAVDTVGSRIGVASGFASLNRGNLTVQLKPLAQRHLSSEEVIARLRRPLARVLGVQSFLQSAQDLRTGGRTGGSQFQFVLLDENLDELEHWNRILEDRLRHTHGIADVTSDQDRAGPQVDVVIDRDAATRMGVSAAQIDNALNNAFSQRQISTIYTQRNQYRVVLEVSPHNQTDPSMLDHIYVGGSTGQQVPLSALAHFQQDSAPLGVTHQGQFPAATISFNLIPGEALGSANALVEQAVRDLGMPETVRTEFAGNAKLLAQSLSTEPLLILAALMTIYIVLGVLYESLLHPLTILSTLPSAGLGALLTLLITGYDFSLIAIIGVFLLMGIVKKNAIMLVDFALEAERTRGLTPEAAIREACLVRFRPIIMTTLAALLGALPLAFAIGTGSELRRPLGIAIAGGLVVSQALTLYTTPVVYLVLDRLSARNQKRARAKAKQQHGGDAGGDALGPAPGR